MIRHTMWPRDWSSDVCSSDLDNSSGIRLRYVAGSRPIMSSNSFTRRYVFSLLHLFNSGTVAIFSAIVMRSEERRVGKDIRFRGVAKTRRDIEETTPTGIKARS